MWTDHVSKHYVNLTARDRVVFSDTKANQSNAAASNIRMFKNCSKVSWWAEQEDTKKHMNMRYGNMWSILNLFKTVYHITYQPISVHIRESWDGCFFAWRNQYTFAANPVAIGIPAVPGTPFVSAAAMPAPPASTPANAGPVASAQDSIAPAASDQDAGCQWSRCRCQWSNREAVLDEKHGTTKCEICRQRVGGGACGYDKHVRTSKHHLSWEYHLRGLPWSQAQARAAKEWARAWQEENRPITLSPRFFSESGASAMGSWRW